MSVTMKRWQADFVVYGEDGQLAAVAEAKQKTGADAEWIAAWYHNYAEHQPGPAPPFVLLVTPEKLYVWKRPAGKSAAPALTAVADASRLFSPYLRRLNADPAELSGQTFEFIVGAWLRDLSHHYWQPTAPEEIRALIETGLLDAVENGRVVADIAA